MLAHGSCKQCVFFSGPNPVKIRRLIFVPMGATCSHSCKHTESKIGSHPAIKCHKRIAYRLGTDSYQVYFIASFISLYDETTPQEPYFSGEIQKNTYLEPTYGILRVCFMLEGWDYLMTHLIQCSWRKHCPMIQCTSDSRHFRHRSRCGGWCGATRT